MFDNMTSGEFRLMRMGKSAEDYAYRQELVALCRQEQAQDGPSPDARGAARLLARPRRWYNVLINPLKLYFLAGRPGSR